MPYQRISHSPTDHIVNNIPNLSNKDPMEEELEKTRKWAKQFVPRITYNENPKPTDEDKRLQRTRLYEDPHDCEICGLPVTRRLSDTKYDYVKEYEMPDFRKNDYPLQMYINADDKASRDKWGNLEPPEVHYCDLQKLSEAKKVASLQQALMNVIEVVKDLDHKNAKLREEAVLKGVILEVKEG